MNLGLINHIPNPVDWKVGSFSPLGDVVLQPDGNWERYLPVVEFQNNHGFDRWACVNYSCLNPLEILYIKQTGTEINFSDRALAVMSGTKIGVGNRLDTVFDTARNFGLVTEAQYPDVKTEVDYYAPLPQHIKDEAKEFLIDWSLYREWVSPYRLDHIKEALKQAPLQVTVRYASGPGLLNPTGSHNHAVTLYNISDGYEIFDHYSQSRKKYSLGYEFGVVLKPTLLRKSNNIMNIKQNALVAKTQGSGYKFGLFIDGKLLIGETADVHAEWNMRNPKDFTNKVSVTLEQWNSFEHYDLKGNKI